MSSTTAPTPAAPAAAKTATEKKPPLTFWWVVANVAVSVGSLTGGTFALAKGLHHPDATTVAFYAAIAILVLNAIIFFRFAGAMMEGFLTFTGWCFSIGAVLTIAGLGISLWEGNQAWRLHLATNGGMVTDIEGNEVHIDGDPVLKTALEQTNKLETRAKYLGKDITLAVEATQADPTDLVAKAAREATLTGLKEKKANKLAWVPAWLPDMSDLFPKLDNVRPIYGLPLWGVVYGVIVAAFAAVIYSILRATSKVGIPAPGNDTFSRMDYVTDRYISSWLGKGVMVFIMGIAVFFLVYRQLPETPMPGSPNWEYARMEAREAELKAEWAARKTAPSEESGSKPRHQQKQKSAKPPKAEPAVAVEERPFLYSVASTAPMVDKGCTVREIGVIAGRTQYSCIPN